MKKILLLGSGELGKEFVISAQRKGQHIIACDSYAGAPAMQVADEFEVFDMLNGEELERVVKKHQPDIIVPEIEAIRTERLYDFEKEGIQVVPSARAVNFTMNRKAIRDLAAKELGLKTARYFYAKTLDELKEAAAKIGFPCVVKPLMSSSGKGQSLVKSADELEHAWEYGCSGSRGDIRELIIEEFIKFDSEITVLLPDQYPVHVHVLGSDLAEEHTGILTFTIDDVHPHDVSEILIADGICVRAGHHCAQPLLNYLGISSATRASFMFYNTEEEADQFVASIASIRERMGYGK